MILQRNLRGEVAVRARPEEHLVEGGEEGQERGEANDHHASRQGGGVVSRSSEKGVGFIGCDCDERRVLPSSEADCLEPLSEETPPALEADLGRGGVDLHPQQALGRDLFYLQQAFRRDTCGLICCSRAHLCVSFVTVLFACEVGAGLKPDDDALKLGALRAYLKEVRLQHAACEAVTLPSYAFEAPDTLGECGWLLESRQGLAAARKVNETVRAHSSGAALVVLLLPPPPASAVSRRASNIDVVRVLTEGLPPTLLTASNGTSPVVTTEI